MLEVRDLHIHFFGSGRDAVDGVSFDVRDGEIVGLVGESGSGKSVSSMAVCGLLDTDICEISGSIKLDGIELTELSYEEFRKLRGDKLSVVFQEPMSSFDPCMTVGKQVEEAILVHKNMSDAERKKLALEAMEQAELDNPENIYDKYPHEFSGGMLQRAMIASAIISEPSLLICDEPTTALDVSIQGEILELLKKINKEKDCSILFISHDLNVVRKICSYVLVMNRGKIVESGKPDNIFNNPREDYTKNLIASIPTRQKKLKDIYGD